MLSSSTRQDSTSLAIKTLVTKRNMIQNLTDIVIDDEAFHNIESGPEPIGPVQPDGVEDCDRAL